MKFNAILLLLVLFAGGVFGQENEENVPKEKRKPPVFHEVSNKDVVTSVFSDAVKVDKVNDYWYCILNNDGKPLGFAMSSVPFCKNVKGYNDLTPVMIITDKNWVIQKVALLSNWETLSYIRKLTKKGFFDLWVGKTLKEAKSVKPDGFTGATLTVVAVTKNVDFMLSKGASKLPKNK
ncbi:MAG: FMN-binding protein [Paludibacter sp.]